MTQAALPPESELVQDPSATDPQIYIQQLKDYIRILRDQNAVMRADLAELQRRERDTVLQRP